MGRRAIDACTTHLHRLVLDAPPEHRPEMIATLRGQLDDLVKTLTAPPPTVTERMARAGAALVRARDEKNRRAADGGKDGGA
jgi:hypothetical protein